MSFNTRRATVGFSVTLFHFCFWILVAYLLNFSITIACFIGSLFLKPLLEFLDKRIDWETLCEEINLIESD